MQPHLRADWRGRQAISGSLTADGQLTHGWAMAAARQERSGPDENSFRLLLIATVVVMMAASQGLRWFIPSLWLIGALSLAGAGLAVVTVAELSTNRGVLLLIGWLLFMPAWTLGGLSYATERSRNGAPPPVAAMTNAEFAERVKQSQQRAIKRYPSLAVLDSPLNFEFRRSLNEWRASDDRRLKDPSWPEELARDSDYGLSRAAAESASKLEPKKKW